MQLDITINFRTAQPAWWAKDCWFWQQICHSQMGQAKEWWWSPNFSLHHPEERQIWWLVWCPYHWWPKLCCHHWWVGSPCSRPQWRKVVPVQNYCCQQGRRIRALPWNKASPLQTQEPVSSCQLNWSDMCRHRSEDPSVSKIYNHQTFEILAI